MRNPTPLLMPALALAAAACDIPNGGWDDLFGGDTASDTASDTAFYSGALEITSIDYRCTPGSPDAWWYSTTASAWAGDAELHVFETGDSNWPNNPNAVWEETHPLTNTAYDEAGTWDTWEATLTDVDSPGSQIAGRSTLWGCWWDDGQSLAYKLTLFDDAGRATDCAIWGNESEQYFNGHRGDRCLCFDSDGRCDN